MNPAYLEMEENGQSRTLVLNREVFRIGRWQDMDLYFNFPDVSRDHAVIGFQGGGFILRDCGSMFGTFVNGKRIQEHVLTDHDLVRVGPHSEMQFVFRLGHPADLSPTEPLPTPAAALHQITLLLEGLRAMGSGHLLQDVLRIVVDSAIELTGAERGFVMLADASGLLKWEVARTRDKTVLQGDYIVISRKTAEWAFREGLTKIEEDLFRVREQHDATVEAEIRSAICVPLRLALVGRSGKRGAVQTIGVLYVDSHERARFLSRATLAALEALSDEAARAIENAQLLKDSMEKLRIEQDLRAAARVQDDLLPPRLRLSAPYDVAGNTLPSRFVGGDFFDYFETDDGTLVFAEGDVSGKGLPAAILAARTYGVFSTAAPLTDGPAQLMAHVNRTLARRPMNGFVTMACATLDASGRLITCNAGHNPPLVIRQDGEIEVLETGGVPLGPFDRPYEQQSVTLAPRECAILYSDGVTECEDPGGEFFGEDRMRECLLGCRGLDASGVLQRIFHAVSDFSGNAPQSDDITVLVVRYLGQTGETSARDRHETSSQGD